MKGIENNKADVLPFIRVAIVDDHKMVADSLCETINKSDTIRVTKTYYDLESCRNDLAKEIPDVLLLDIEFPEDKTAGMDFCIEISKAYPELKIIMLTGYKVFNLAKNALRTGAHGYILKGSDSEVLLTGIKTVSMGEQFLCEKTDALLKDRKKEEIVRLTPTEKIILKYLVDGYSRKEIADFQKCSEGTIKIHIRNIRTKFKARNTAELVKKCCDMKYV